MFTKRTIIGTAVGSVIIAIGIYSLITSIGVQEIPVNDTYGIGESTTYQFSAPQHSIQSLNITGNSFHLELHSPENGLQLTDKEYKKELSLEWTHVVDGESTLKIKNTGDSEVNVSGYFTALLDPIQITYHILVIIAGIIIIGFSAGFSIRKPRGF